MDIFSTVLTTFEMRKKFFDRCIDILHHLVCFCVRKRKKCKKLIKTAFRLHTNVFSGNSHFWQNKSGFWVSECSEMTKMIIKQCFTILEWYGCFQLWLSFTNIHNMRIPNAKIWFYWIFSLNFAPNLIFSTELDSLAHFT
jgi:hypothetical protein